MTEPDGIGFEIDCLMLLDLEEPELTNELWAQANLNELNTSQND